MPEQIPQGDDGNRGLAAVLEVLGPIFARTGAALRSTTETARLGQLDGRPVLQLGSSRVPIDHDPAWQAQMLSAPPPAGRFIVAGVGDGALVEAALAAWADTQLVAWERDADVLRSWLQGVPPAVVAAVKNGRLAVVLDTDILHLPPISHSDRVVPHPVLGATYARARAVAEGAAGDRVIVGEGKLIAADLAGALAAAGWAPWPLNIERVGGEGLIASARTLSARAVCVINHAHGLAEICERAGLTLLTWEIDPAMDRPRRPAQPVPNTHVFTWRHANVAAFRAVGFGSVHHLPLAAPDRRRPLALSAEDQDRFGAPVSFVGESMAARASSCATAATHALARWLERRGRAATDAPSLVQQVLQEQRRDLDAWVIPGILRHRFPGLEAADSGSRVDMLLGEVVAAERRLQRVAALAPFGIHAWGDAGWERLRAHGVRVRGRAGHFDTLTRIYNATRINIDIGRLYQRDIVTMRVFDVLRCGAFVLADHSEALAAMLQPGVEVETWRTVGELVDKCRWYLAHPAAAQAIAARGRAAVCERHDIGSRVQTMLTTAGLAPAVDPEPR